MKSKNKKNQKMIFRSNHYSSIKHRLTKYSLGSQSVMLLSGLIGITTDSNANLTALDLSTIENESISKNGVGTIDPDRVRQDLTQSSDSNDELWVNGGGVGLGDVMITGVYGARIGYVTRNSTKVPRYLSVGFNINLNSVGFTKANQFIYDTLVYDVGYGNLGSDQWQVDRPNGAIAFRNGDGNYGFIRVSWVASTSTMTFLSGVFEDTENNITVTAAPVPEPAHYAAALGLGALGLAYYRRRPGNKTRAKS